MEQIALRSGDLEQIAAAYTHQVYGRVIVGDIEGAERLIASALSVAQELRQPARIWIASALRDGMNLLKGRLEGLDEAIEDTYAIGMRATPEMAIPVYHLQRYELCGLRGTLADAEPQIAELATEFPWRPDFRCVLAQIQARTGRLDEAQAALTALAEDDCAALPFDGVWLFAMSLLAETCASSTTATRRGCSTGCCRRTPAGTPRTSPRASEARRPTTSRCSHGRLAGSTTPRRTSEPPRR